MNCQRLNDKGHKCGNVAVYTAQYHGDHEIYGDTETQWVLVFLCKDHAVNRSRKMTKKERGE